MCIRDRSIGDYVASLLPRNASGKFGVEDVSKALKIPKATHKTDDQIRARKPQNPFDGLHTTAEGAWSIAQLRDALERAGKGSQSRLAEHFGISPAAVRSALKHGVPAKWTPKLEEFFGTITQPDAQTELE